MPQTQSATSQTLYDRLGRKEGIRRLVDDIVTAHMENPIIKARFLPYAEQPARLATVKKHLCQFMASGTGGPDHYEGKSMPEAHRGMNISEKEYVAAIDDILGVMHDHALGERTRNDVLAILYSLKEEIIHE